MAEVLTLNSDKNMVLGTWVWHVADHLKALDTLLEFLQKNSVTEAYYSINRDVSDEEYVYLIEKTAAVGIRSAALSGDCHWILPEFRRDYEEYISRVERINSLCKGDKFYSLHLDVEPHVLPEAKQHGLSEFIPLFVELIENARSHADRLQIDLEWDIPSWIYKHTDHKNNCSLTETLFRCCEAVGIMAYRDFAQGQIDITLPNIEFAKKFNRSLIVGCETIRLDEDLRPDGNCPITYFEEGRDYMYQELSIVKRALLKEYDRTGFAIHSIEGWMSLKD